MVPGYEQEAYALLYRRGAAQLHEGVPLIKCVRACATSGGHDDPAPEYRLVHPGDMIMAAFPKHFSFEKNIHALLEEVRKLS